MDEKQTKSAHQEPLAPHHGLLEQLNIPPKAISFIRENAKILQLGAVAVVILVVATIGYGAYQDAQKEKSDTLFYRAMQETDAETRSVRLQELLQGYPSSNAALWSQLELAHVARADGRLQEALTGYEGVMGQLDSDSPLASLVLMALGQIHEASGDMDAAASYYDQLTGFAGYEYLALTARARIHEQLQELPAALEIYESLLNDANLSPAMMQWLISKRVLLVDAGGQQ
jgi:predicted negative regulator of RcsB-dependent stress response